MAFWVNFICFIVTNEGDALPTVLLRHLNILWGCFWKLFQSCGSYILEKEDDCRSWSARVNVLNLASIAP